MRSRQWFLLPFLIAVASAAGAAELTNEVRHLLERHCYDCHAGAEAESGVDYAAMATVGDFAADPDHLPNLLWVLEEGEMPPAKAERPLAKAQREQLIAWVRAVLVDLENAQPGDPGVVVMPRLTHLQYDRVIAQLTGQPITAAALLPRDASSHSGFINDGTYHTVSPEHVEAYLETAARVLSHARIGPAQGIVWHQAPQMDAGSPQALRMALTEDWVLLHRSEEERLVGKQRVWSEADLLSVLWRYRHRQALGLDDDLPALARANEPSVPGHVARLWWERLHPQDPDPAATEALALFKRLALPGWEELPGPDVLALPELRERCTTIAEQFAGFVSARMIGRKQKVSFDLARARKQGREPDTLSLVLTGGGGGAPQDLTLVDGELVLMDGSKRPLREIVSELVAEDGRRFPWGRGNDRIQVPDTGAVITSPAVIPIPLPAQGKELTLQFTIEKAAQTAPGMTQIYLAETPPDAKELQYTYGERGLGTWDAYGAAWNLGNRATKVRSYGGAGGEFARNQYWIWFNDYDDVPLERLGSSSWKRGPPDQASVEETERFMAEILHEDPLSPLMLRAAHLREEFTAAALERLAVLREELRLAAQVPQQELRDLLHQHGHRDYAEGEAVDGAVLTALPAAVQARARELATAIAEHERLVRARAEPLVAAFAARALGEPIGGDRLARLMAPYDAARRIGRSFDAAVKQSLKAVLISPDFLYRLPATAEPSAEATTLAGIDLAERLSFALWGRGPDQELRSLAEQGQLDDPDVLAAQAQRLLRDERSRALAVDFLGYWLGFAEFDEHGRPNPERFPDFATLRASMYEEAIRFTHHVFAEDRPLTELIDADYAFVDEALADFYGIPWNKGARGFRKVQLPSEVQDQRGGVFGLAALLTKTSSALRTSPVLRGTWIVTAVLGHPLPEPPADVPMISQDETDEQGRSIAEQLAEHRANPACAACHARIDPPGVALERFDAIGRWRETYLNGDAIDDRGEQDGGAALTGIAGLRAYVGEHRDDFLRNLCRRFVSYALGRAVTITDRPLIDEMLQALAESEYRPSAMVATLVRSPQFRHRRDLVADQP